MVIHSGQSQLKQQLVKIDTNITLILPKKAKAFITSKFRGDEIYEINNETQRLWIEILNNSYQENLKIARNSVLGFIVIEPDNLKHKHETQNTIKRKGTTENGELLDKKDDDKEGGFSIDMISPMLEEIP